MTIEEALPEPANPLGVDGIEFVEYATVQLGSEPVASGPARSDGYKFGSSREAIPGRDSLNSGYRLAPSLWEPRWIILARAGAYRLTLRTRSRYRTRVFSDHAEVKRGET